MAKPKKSKRFKYNLQSVLKVRKIREEQEREKLEKYEKELQEEIQKEEELKELLNIAYTELRECLTTGAEVPDPQEIMRKKAYLEVMQAKVDEQVKKREEAEKKRDDQREVLINAVKDRKIMEKDKEKKQKAWKKLMDKEEMKFLDEVAVIGFEKKRREATELEKKSTPK